MPGISHESRALGFRVKNYIVDDMDAAARELNISRSKLICLASVFATRVHRKEFEEFVKRNDVLLNPNNHQYK